MTALQSSHFKDLKDGTGGGENGAMTALQSSHFTDLKVRVAESLMHFAEGFSTKEITYFFYSSSFINSKTWACTWLRVPCLFTCLVSKIETPCKRIKKRKEKKFTPSSNLCVQNVAAFNLQAVNSVVYMVHWKVGKMHLIEG